MASIIFITGCSASGKTTLYESLRNDTDLKKHVFHDIDEDGVPPVGRLGWREYRVEHLLFNAVNEALNGLSTVICGITFPHEVTESLYFPVEISVHFIALRASNDKIRERLLVRADQNNESSTFDESFDNGNIENAIFENIRNQGIITRSVNTLKNGHVVDTEKISTKEMHDIAKVMILNLNKE